MKLNDIPRMKRITGTKVVYNVYFDTQKLDVMESAGALTEQAVRQSIREEIMELSEGGCYIPHFCWYVRSGQRLLWMSMSHAEKNYTNRTKTRIRICGSLFFK